MIIVLNSIEKITKIKNNFKIVKRRKGDVDFLSCSIVKAKQKIKWKPVYSNIKNLYLDEYNHLVEYNPQYYMYLYWDSRYINQEKKKNILSLFNNNYNLQCSQDIQYITYPPNYWDNKKIFSIDFSERFEVPSVQVAYDLIQKGEIGNVVQTIGMGPHRLNLPTRPEWFFDYDKYGGILCDIASHQIDQFLFFTGSTQAEIISSSTGNFAHPQFPKFEDFGEILIHGDKGRGYIRVDWYTPDALPNWGDGRLTIIGTEGYIELRKYVDVVGRDGTDHIFLVNKEKYEYINASSQPLTYFQRLMNDVIERTSTAMQQDHCLKVMNLAINAQLNAKKMGNLK